MANPGYPMQPMQPPHMGQGPMGHGPMGQGPMGHGPMGQGPIGHGPNVIRRGTSRVVPVVVSAGLAVGVFCGLLFGLGVENGEAIAGSTPTSSAKQVGEPEVPAPFKPTDTPAVVATPPVAKAATAVAPTPPTPAAGSGSAGSGAPAVVAAAGSGSTVPTVPSVPVTPTAKLTIEVTPDSIAKIAKITVDGKSLDSNELEVDLGTTKKKQVKIVVKASGYKDVEQKLEVLADHDNVYKVELVKRSTGGGVSRPPPPGGNGNKKPGGNKKPPGGGLIDI